MKLKIKKLQDRAAEKFPFGPQVNNLNIFIYKNIFLEKALIESCRAHRQNLPIMRRKRYFGRLIKPTIKDIFGNTGKTYGKGSGSPN